jgi:hypothetical protein
MKQLFVFYVGGIIHSICEDPYSAERNDDATKGAELVSIIAPTLDICWDNVPGIYIPCMLTKTCSLEHA